MNGALLINGQLHFSKPELELVLKFYADLRSFGFSKDTE